MLRGAPHDRIGELGLLTSNCVYVYIYMRVCVCVYIYFFLIWRHIVYVCVDVNDCICMCEHLSPSGPTFVNLCFLGPCIQSMLHATLCEAKRPSLGYPHGRDWRAQPDQSCQNNNVCCGHIYISMACLAEHSVWPSAMWPASLNLSKLKPFGRHTIWLSSQGSRHFWWCNLLRHVKTMAPDLLGSNHVQPVFFWSLGSFRAGQPASLVEPHLLWSAGPGTDTSELLASGLHQTSSDFIILHHLFISVRICPCKPATLHN